MSTRVLNCYTIDKINEIIFKGFNFELPEETVSLISELAIQVGSPDYVKTPIFVKKDGDSDQNSQKEKEGFVSRKRRGNKNNNASNDWEAIRSFQTTKMEEKIGIDVDIDGIRGLVNKLTDKNYNDILAKICEIIDRMISENIDKESMKRVSLMLFEIASNNRFYSALYSELYAELSKRYPIMESTFQSNLDNFTEMFNRIEYVDPNKNYDMFCEVNKINEKRKALAAFYVNLMNNGIISSDKIVSITRNLLCQLYTFISIEDKKNEVDELTETVAILYKKGMYDEDEDGDDCNYELIDGLTIPEVVKKIATGKVKDYKSLSNKSLFKFMDLVEM